jgi:8-oxo-dGTP pyrophosphatase MutT (NUDIX family)
VTEDQRVLIERQYRPAVEKVTVDYPAGGIEPDDKDPEAAILRELQEETGYRPGSLKELAVVDSIPGLSSTRFHVFLAEGVFAAGEASPEPTESIVTEFVPARQILKMIDSGEMACASCISATFYAFRELGWFKLDLAD